MSHPPRARASFAALALLSLLPAREALAQRPAPARQGALVSGLVRFDGAVPPRPPLPVSPHAAHMGCGSTPPADESLVVDATSRGVRNTVVWLESTRTAATTPGPSDPLPAVTANVDQRGCAFDPHVLAVRTSQGVRFGNSDTGVLHNVHAYVGLTGTDTAFNLATPAGLSATHAFTTARVHRLVCDAGHGWMLMYVHPFAHRLFAVSDAQGRFSISDVPAGSYTLRVWHEGFERGADDAQGRPTYSAPLVLERPVTVRGSTAVVLPPVVVSAAPAAMRFEPPRRR